MPHIEILTLTLFMHHSVQYMVNKGQGISILLLAVMWIRIRLDPDSFGSVDSELISKFKVQFSLLLKCALKLIW